MLWVCIPFVFLFPFFYYFLKTGNFDRVFKLKRVWTRIILTCSFLFPVIEYKSQKYKMPGPCVIVSNHSSYLDITISPLYIDHTAAYLGKSELLKVFLFRSFFLFLDIPVDRKSLTGSHKAFLKAGERIEQGISIVIYPEGTISERGKLRPFKKGAFKLAIEKQVPIVPVVNLNNWWFLQNGGYFKSNGRPGIPRIIVGDPIETKGLTQQNIGELKQKVFNFTQTELDKFYGGQN